MTVTDEEQGCEAGCGIPSSIPTGRILEHKCLWMLVEKSLPTFSCFQCEFSIFVPNEIKMSVPRSGRWNASAMIKVWINYTVNMFFIRRKVWIFLDRNVSLRLLGLILCLRNSSS